MNNEISGGFGVFVLAVALISPEFGALLIGLLFVLVGIALVWSYFEKK